jgi:hypothetical protein
VSLLRFAAHRLRPRLRRETCKRCWRENAVGFSVSDDVWRAVVPARHIANVLCLYCFDRYATRRGIDWVATGCELFPVAGATSSSRRSSSTCTGRTLRRLSAWWTVRRSRSSASLCSSYTSARCRTESPSASAKGRLRAFLPPLLADCLGEGKGGPGWGQPTDAEDQAAASTAVARALISACERRASIVRSAWRATRSMPRIRSGVRPK